MKPLKLVQFAWPVEIALTFLAWMIIVFFLPGKIDTFMKPMPQLLAFIGTQAAVGFGGTPLKRKLENERVANEPERLL